MTRGAEIPQLDLLSVLNLLRIRITPFHWHFTVGVRIDQDVESTAAGVELRKECHRSSDLAEDCLDLELDFLFGFLRLGRGRVAVFGVLSILVDVR